MSRARLAFLALWLLACPWAASAQTQQPPQGGFPTYGIVCDGATQTVAAIQQAIDNLPANGSLQLPPGICLVNQTIQILKPMRLEGTGLGLTQLRSTVANIPVINIDAAVVTVSGLFVTHAGLNPVAGGDGLVVKPFRDAVYLDHILSQFNWRGFVLDSIAYGSATNLTASLNNSHGFEFLYNGYHGNQWDVVLCNSQQNHGAGYKGDVGTNPQGLGPFLTQTTSYLNEQGGYIFLGHADHTLFDIRLNNVLSSYDNLAGIYFDTYGASHIILNPWIEYTGIGFTGGVIGADLVPIVPSNSGHCLRITPNNLPGLPITGGHYINCAWSALSLEAPSVSFIGGGSYDNGAVMDPDPCKRAGVCVAGSNVLVSGHAFTTTAATLLHYIYITGNPGGVSIGENSYASVLAPQDWLGVDPATPTLGGVTQMIGGLAVHTNRSGADALKIYDGTNGPTPLKSLRVINGALEVRAADGTTPLMRLSDVGTPEWTQRRGQVALTGASATSSVTFVSAEPDSGFFVQLTPTAQAGTPATGAFTVSQIDKTTGGFTVHVLAAPGAGNTVVYDWFVYR